MKENNMKYRLNGFMIPERMIPGIERYVNEGIPPGGFLTAVICNDLYGACAKADDENIRNIPAYVNYFYNYAPSSCWGSKEKMEIWIKNKQEMRQNNEK